jgi:hypothetical protein
MIVILQLLRGKLLSFSLSSVLLIVTDVFQVGGCVSSCVMNQINSGPDIHIVYIHIRVISEPLGAGAIQLIILVPCIMLRY